MKRTLLLTLLVMLVIPLMSHAQLNPQQGHGAPSGVCLGPYTDIDTGNFYVCKTGVYALAGGSGTSVIGKGIPAASPSSGAGIKADVQVVYDATFTSGQATVGTGSSDPCFTSADIGKFVLATNWNSATQDAGYNGAILKFASGTTIASVQSCHSATMSNNVIGASCAAVCAFGWGTDDDAAWTNVENLADAGPQCQSVTLPAGYSFVHQAHFIVNPTTCSNSQTGSPRGQQITGQGKFSTTIVPLPSFNFATCTGGPGGASPGGCFFSALGMTAQDLSINGLGWGNTGTQTVAVIAQGADAQVLNVQLTGWGQNDTAMTCLSLAGNSAWQVIIDACGFKGLLNQNSFYGGEASFIGLEQGPCMDVVASTLAVTKGGNFTTCGQTAGQPVVNLQSNATWKSWAEAFSCTSASGQIGVLVATGATFIFRDGIGNCNGTNDATIRMNGTGQLIMSGSKIGAAGGLCGVQLNSTTATFLDEGGNSWNGVTDQVCTTASGNSPLYGNELNGINSVGLTNNVGAATLFAVPASLASDPAQYGIFAVHYDMILVTAGTTGTIAFNAICNNGTATNTNPGTATLSITAAAGTEAAGVVYCRAQQGTTLQYSTTGIVTPGSLSYKLTVRVEPK